MATYLHNKTRAFKTPGDPCDLPLSSKSLFHLKSYSSATDPRAWANDTVDRKQYILDMFAAEASTNEIFIGKYVNIQALLKTLLTNKDADIVYLQNQLQIVEGFLDEMDLTNKQRTALQLLRSKMPGGDANILSSLSGKPSTTDLTKSNNDSIDMIPANHDMLIGHLNSKFKEQEVECARQKALAHDAIQKLTTLKSIVEERDRLKRHNDHLERSIAWFQNTKASSNNDLSLQSEISRLRMKLEKEQSLTKAAKSSLARLNVHKEQFSINPEHNIMHDAASVTSGSELHDVAKVIEEREYFKSLVANLLMQIESLKRFAEPPNEVTSRGDIEYTDRAAQNVEQQHSVQSQIGKNIVYELETLRDRVKDYDIKCLECDRLRLRIGERALIEKEYENLKAKYNTLLQEQRHQMTQSSNEIDYFKEKCMGLQTEVTRYKLYGDENNTLCDRCKTLQNVVNTLQERIRYLETNIPTSLDNSHLQINELKEALDQKSNIIKISEDKLNSLQKQLRDTINSLNCESTILKNSLCESHLRINGLLEQENNYQNEIKQLKDALERNVVSVDNRKTNINMAMPKVMQDKDNLIAQLRKKLLELQRENEMLAAMGSKIQHFFAKKTTMIHKSIGECNSSRSSLKHNHKRTDSIHNAMQKLQRDLSDAKLSYNDPNFFMLQGRYKEIQSLAKNQVKLLASELRKCKARVQCLESRYKRKR